MAAPKFGDDMALGYLDSIDKSLKELVELSRTRLARTAAAPAPAASQGRAPNSERVASESDLSGKYGDPEVRFDPRDWIGSSMKGRHFSECSSAFLEQLASVLDTFSERETDQKKASYKRMDAARARGWAVKNRNRPATEEADDDDGSLGGGSASF